MAQVFGHAAVLAGVPIDEYVRDGETLARCQLAAWERYGYDAVFAVMDVNVETEAVGSVLRYRADQYPVIDTACADASARTEHASSARSPAGGRMPEMLKALGILRRELGDEVPVVGCVLGPFTLAAQLLGLETVLYLAADDPARLERVHGFRDRGDCPLWPGPDPVGAHLPVVFDPAASPAVVPPAFFREFELPRLQRVFRVLDHRRRRPGTGSISPDPWPRFSLITPKAGVHLANFDYCVPAAEAGGLLPATCLDGNIRSLSFVEASPAQIAAESHDLLHVFRGRAGFILSSGCEIPLESKPDNVAAMVHAPRVPG